MLKRPCKITFIIKFAHTYVHTYIHTYIQTYRHTYIHKNFESKIRKYYLVSKMIAGTIYLQI